MKKAAVLLGPLLMVSAWMTGQPTIAFGDELALTYTTPECSTTVRKGRTYGTYSTTILWANDGSSTAADYAARNNMYCQAGVIMCTPTECSWPLTGCYQYTAQWVRVGLAGKSPTQLNLVNPQCPAD